MKIIHFRGEFGEPCTMKAVCDGIYWNEYCGNWSVYTEWGHAQCETISQAKRTHRSKFTGEYMALNDGSKFPVLSSPPIYKGGHTHNHKRNKRLLICGIQKKQRRLCRRDRYEWNQQQKGKQ